MTPDSPQALTLSQLTSRVQQLVQQPATQNLWVIAELSDVAVRGGHCYMELLEKDSSGRQLAKARGIIWASTYGRIAAEFRDATGQQFASGLKVMLRVSATFSPLYGFSLQVSAVNPEFTMGDLLRRRQEILRRLAADGILEMNRQLRWPSVPQRIAVISAHGAAGYGDFLNQLYTNASHIRFSTTLFPAIMQGAQAPASIIAALDAVAAQADSFDGVVIIRGGGATSDLQAFEDYELAATVAQFPLPVAIGIGHERDVTVLDWVANQRLKTPTAVAEWLVSCGERLLAYLITSSHRILQTVTDRLAGNREQLAQAATLLPVAASTALDRASFRLRQDAGALEGVAARRLHPLLARLDMSQQALPQLAQAVIARQKQRLDADAQLLNALSPQATLARGYSITRLDGHALTDAALVPPGSVIVTTLAKGTLTSTTL